MKKICSECNTENELHYLYCKNCGNPLESEEPSQLPVNEEPAAQVPPAAPAQNPYGVNNSAPQSYQPTYSAAPAPAVPNSVADIDKQDYR